MTEVPAAPPDFSWLTRYNSPDEYLEYARAVSEHFATPEGLPVPPQARHFDAAGRAGWGIGSRTVARVVSPIALQEELGFIVRGTAAHWDEATFVEHGRWASHVLGSPEHPVPPTTDQIRQLARLSLSPIYELITNMFGDWDTYLEKLGFVTRTMFTGWSDEQWRDNGIWVSHMLGSPDEPVMPKSEDIKIGGIVKIIPTYDAVREKFGSIAEYQRFLGFEVWESPLPYEEWNRDTYVQNGIWLSHAMGTPEHPVMPRAEDLTAAAALGLCPPAGAIGRVFEGTARYQDAIGFVSRYTLSRWTRAEWVQNGQWLADLLGSPDQPRTPTADDLVAASSASIGPTYDNVIEEFGSISAYQEALGLRPHRLTHWSDRDYLRYGFHLVTDNHGLPPSETTYNEATAGPSYSQIATRFGSLVAFHERLGIPDYRSWTAEHLVNLGVQWALEHGGTPPNTADLKYLRQQGKAPAYTMFLDLMDGIDEFVVAVRIGVAQHAVLHETLVSVPTITDAAARHLLRDFRGGDNYALERIGVAQLLATRLGQDAQLIGWLLNLFGTSRVSVHWERQDYLAFGNAALTLNAPDTRTRLENLALLNAAGLAPYPQDIADVFGSLEAFVETLADEAEAEILEHAE